jgi:hypothetical protein
MIGGKSISKKIVMKKSILNLVGAQELSKKEQKSIICSGGFSNVVCPKGRMYCADINFCATLCNDTRILL